MFCALYNAGLGLWSCAWRPVEARNPGYPANYQTDSDSPDRNRHYTRLIRGFAALQPFLLLDRTRRCKIKQGAVSYSEASRILEHAWPYLTNMEGRSSKMSGTPLLPCPDVSQMCPGTMWKTASNYHCDCSICISESDKLLTVCDILTVGSATGAANIFNPRFCRNFKTLLMEKKYSKAAASLSL